MLRRRLFLAYVLVVYLEVVAKAKQECLDQISSGRRCCTPSAFTKLSFQLHLNSVAERCDRSSYLDQGVRLEVRRPGYNWEPVRLYTARMESRNCNTITVLPGERDSHFPVFEAPGTEPFTVSEYLCGTEYYTPGTQYRWLQGYNSSVPKSLEAWTLGDVSVTYNEHGIHCSAILTKYHFRDGNRSSLDPSSWTHKQGSSQPGTLYFSEISEHEVDGFSQRSVLLTPTWWNGNCSNRTTSACELSEECRTKTISDEMCSVGAGLQCQCQYPQVAGHDNICFDALVGFERTMYDVSEHDTAKVCVGVLSGRLSEDAVIQVSSSRGTARSADFTPLDTSVTLTATNSISCVSISITDDSTPENMESFTVSLTLTGLQNSAIVLSEASATVSIADNDVVMIYIDNDTIQEGQSMSSEVHNARNSDIRILGSSSSGTATRGVDYSAPSATFTIGALSSQVLRITGQNDSIWEGDEDFRLSVRVSSATPQRNYWRTLLIRDSNILQVGFNDTDYTIRENDGSITMCVTVQKGIISDNAALTLGVSTQQIPESAQEVLDYRGISKVITFNSSVSINCFPLIVVDDNGVEENELLMISLSLLQGTHNVNFSQQSVTIEIMDNDVLRIGFVQAMYNASEGDTYAMVCVEVKEGSLSIPLNFSLSSYNQTADQSSLLDGITTVTLSMDEYVVCQNIMFDDDIKYEESEVLSLSLFVSGEQNSAVEISPDTATIYIIDDDALSLGIRMNNTVVEAVGSVDACVEILSGELDAAITVQLFTLDGTAQDKIDYIGLPATNAYLNSTHHVSCVSISIIDDLLYEDTEFLSVSLSIVGHQRSAVTLSQNVHIIYITNDDDLYVGFESSVYTASEIDPSVSVCIEVKDGQLGAAINIIMSIEGRSAQANDDFRGSENRMLTLEPPLETPFCVNAINVINDNVFEDNEMLSLSLTLTDTLNEVNITHPRATIVIIDEDMVTVGLDQSEYTVREDVGLLLVCVTVPDSRKLGTNLTLQLEGEARTAEENIDFKKLSRDFHLSPTHSRQCISVEIINDTSFESNESMTLSLSHVGVQERVEIVPNAANVMIADDDELVIGFRSETYTVPEGQLHVQVCFGILTGSLGTEVTLQLYTQNGTATENMDYQRLSKQFKFSENVWEYNVSIEIVDDDALEQNESLTVHLSLEGIQERISISPQSTIVIITNDDEVAVGLETNYTMAEGDGMIDVCVAVLSGRLGSDLTLQLSTESETATDGIDFDGLQEHILTLNSTAPRSCVQISITNDTLYEDRESFTVSLSVIGQIGSAVQLSENSTTLVIMDDDDIHVDFVSSFYSTNESAGAIDVCVSVVRGQLGTNITLELNTLKGTAKAVDDFKQVKSTVTLSPAQLEGCVKVDIVDDEAVEFSETITVSLSQVGVSDSSLHIPEKPVSVNITDDDVAVIELKKTVTATETSRLVTICAVTNNTLERTFNLSVIAELTMRFNNKSTQSNIVHHHVQLKPGAVQECITYNITLEQELTFFVTSPDAAIEIVNPNGTIFSEPSLDEIFALLSGDDIDLLKIVQELDKVVDTLIENEQTASYEFSSDLIDVVSRVLDITNRQSPKQSENKSRVDSNPAPGTSLLKTMDKFALRSFNRSLGAITSNNTRIDVLNIDETERVDTTITTISGPSGEMIEIQTDSLARLNFSVTVGSYYFRNVSGLLPGSIPTVRNSELISSVLSSALWCEDHPCDPINVSELVRISVSHQPVTESEEPRCVFYNLTTDQWSESGCIVGNESNSTLTVCNCNHLTHFAVMLSPKNSVNKQDAYNMRIIGYVGTSISLVCLLIIIIIFTMLKSLWSMRNYIHVNLAICLFLAQLLFVAGVDKSQNQIACQTIAVVLHYAYLVTFMWMLMEGVVLYVALVRVFVTKPHRYIIGFTVVSYGAPMVYMALVVPLGFLLPHGPHYGGEICWLRYDTHFVWAFISPVVLIIISNVGFFFMAIYIIWKQQARKNLSTSQIQKAKHWLKVSVSLLVVMGISWIIGVITFHEALLFVSYIFTVVVAFQGAIMFIMFVILSKQVRQALKKWLVRNVIMKSDYLSEHFSDFTRSTQAGYSQSHSTSSTKHGAVAEGVQLGVFLALPAKPSVVDELKKEYEAELSSSPPAVLPSPSPTPSTPYASSCNSPIPHLPSESHLEEDDEDGAEGPPNIFTVIYVTNDKDSGRGSPDTDTICTPPPDNSPTLNPLSVCNMSGTNLQ